MKPSLIFSAIGASCGALVLAALFWWPLFRGGGFVGGDVYSYYLPQKVVYAEHLRHAELPLWNDRAGHGYPIVGESQTGAFYPPNAILYRLLGVNAAYNANHVLHYLLAVFFAWMYARAIGLSVWSSGLTALVLFMPGSRRDAVGSGPSWAALGCRLPFGASKISCRRSAAGPCLV
jgi:hypothetical protein